jgi:uncharacterized membrane protein YadS
MMTSSHSVFQFRQTGAWTGSTQKSAAAVTGQAVVLSSHSPQYIATMSHGRRTSTLLMYRMRIE